MTSLRAAARGIALLAALVVPPGVALAASGAAKTSPPADASAHRFTGKAAQLRLVSGAGRTAAVPVQQHKRGPLAKLDTTLAGLATQAAGGALRGLDLKALRARESTLRLQPTGAGRLPSVLVDATARSKADAAVLKAALQRTGLARASSYGNLVSGWLPVDALATAALLPQLVELRGAHAMTRAGIVTSQGDFAQRSYRLRAPLAAMPLSGAGIKVGVLSDSYNCLGGAAAGVASDDLPAAGVQVLKEISDCDGAIDEGRAMAELIHDVAPGAAIAFYTAFEGQADFANGIIALADAGATVIVDDVGYFAEPVYQDGLINQAIDSVAARGVSYFSSAGNSGRNGYEAAFVPAFTTEELGREADFDPSGAVNNVLPVTVLAGDTAFFILHWDQPYATGGGPGSASDVDFCFTLDDGTIIDPGLCGFANNLGRDPVEVIGIFNDGEEDFDGGLRVGVFAGPTPARLKIVSNGSGEGLVGGPFATNSGTIQGHPLALGGAAVGASNARTAPECEAVPSDGSPLALKEAFSSAGGSPTLFTVTGVRLGTPMLRRKPNFTGPDGGNTTFFGRDIADTPLNRPPQCKDPDSFGNFFGTSASAPHVAAVAALLQERRPGLLPQQVYTALGSTTSQMLAPGFDFDTGAGFVTADAAATATAPANVISRLETPVVGRGTTSTAPILEGPAGSYQFSARICARPAQPTLGGTFSRTVELTNGNSLVSRSRDVAGGLPGGPGSEQDFLPEGGYADGQLAATECTDQTYRIGLVNRNKFTFTVDFFGNAVP